MCGYDCGMYVLLVVSKNGVFSFFFLVSQFAPHRWCWLCLGRRKQPTIEHRLVDDTSKKKQKKKTMGEKGLPDSNSALGVCD